MTTHSTTNEEDRPMDAETGSTHDDAVKAAATKILRWGIDEARARDAMYDEASTIGIEAGLSDEEINRLAERIETAISAIVPTSSDRRYVAFAGRVPDGDFAMLASSATGDTSRDALEFVRSSSRKWVEGHPLAPWEEVAIFELVETVAVGPEMIDVAHDLSTPEGISAAEPDKETDETSYLFTHSHGVRVNLSDAEYGLSTPEAISAAEPCEQCSIRRDEHADQETPSAIPALDITDHSFQASQDAQTKEPRA